MSKWIEDIRAQRQELKVSQEQVAEWLKVSRYTVLRWEHDTGKMPLGAYITLQKKFKKLKEVQRELDRG